VTTDKQKLLVFSVNEQPLPVVVEGWLLGLGLPVISVRTSDDLLSMSLRGRPRVAVFDCRKDPDTAYEAGTRLKRDSYTAVVPTVMITSNDDEAFARAFAAGADEVIRESLADDEARIRLDSMLRRSDRDLVVHPSTRLPGAVEIEAEVTRRLHRGAPFAMCYADLDHFKEYNDRYSYYDGDRCIRILAKVLHDVVKGLCRDDGFVGHIGGDDFIFVIPMGVVSDVCAEIVSVFDTLIPYQYSEQDRRAGYFFGKDRRGQLHRVPLMTVSIGVVTNARRKFKHAAQMSELATEMKSYAKTLPGSVFTVDRRTDDSPLDATGVERAGAPGQMEEP
jgi:GGDEF domain-containing protein